MIDIDQITFRASGVGNIMTDSKNSITEKQLETIDELMAKRIRTEKQEKELARLIAKRDENSLGDTCTNYLKQVWREHATGRSRHYTNKYIEKGIYEEEKAITLLSLYKGVYFKKNSERIYNRYVQGEPDLFVGESIQKAKEGFDTKCAWDLWTFPYEGQKISKNHYWQNQTYICLSNADRWTTAYCLINAPANLIQHEKEKIFYATGSNEADPEYKQRCIEIEKNLIFDMKQFRADNPFYDLDCLETGTPVDAPWEFDIPLEKRVIEFVVERDNDAIAALYDRVGECRAYMRENFLKSDKI